jgi:hypothetical protein
MQYLLLIYDTEVGTDRPELRAEYRKFTEEIIASGHYAGGNALQPVTTATSVRVRDGKTMLTDGPFAETREQLAGYYLIEAATPDEAKAIAARIPSSRHGTIEVRPVWVQAAQTTGT